MKESSSCSLLFLSAWTVALVLALCAPARAMTNNWKASTTGDWSDAANWVEGFIPTNGDDAVITNSGASVIISSSSSNLNSLTLSRTLWFTNWDTYLQASNVSILSNGSMTCVGAFTNNAMSNRVYIICTNLTIAAGGSINADTRGYSGGLVSGGGHGPGGAQGSRAGGSYGGKGGNYAWLEGSRYGSSSVPEYAGSGGGYNSVNAVRGGHGGGAVRIDASDTVILNGFITANGENGSADHAGSGSGGSVWISCRTLAGAETIANTCLIRANGGSSWATGQSGSGGGGRIAIVYDPTAQSTSSVPPLNLSVLGGTTSYKGELGTISVPDGQLLTEPATMARWNGEVLGVASWSPTNLVVSNCTIRFAAAGFRLAVSNELRIATNGVLMLGGDSIITDASVGLYGPFLRYTSTTAGPSLTVSGNLVVTNNGALHVYGGVTNNTTADYGASVSIQGNVNIYSGCSILPVSHPTNGGSVLFSLNNLYIQSGASINAVERGFAGGAGATAYGPGKGGNRSGGGYGGGGGYSPGGATYGLSNAPAQPGSGGGVGNGGQSGLGGNGGGLIRIIAAESITIDGSLNAYAASGWTQNQGAGSGGGIYLRCRTLGGMNISLLASGGSLSGGVGGGGGGGRIAVWRMYSSGTVTTSVSGGTAGSYPGTNGTVTWHWIPVPGTIFTMH